MFDRIRISAQGRNQLIQIKRKTGIETYNIICRYALVLSLSEKSLPPKETFSSSGGLEIEWRVFCGNENELYENLLVQRCKVDDLDPNYENLKDLLLVHLHRGLAYLNANPEQIFLV